MSMNELEIIESSKGDKEPYPTTNLHIAAVLKTVGHKFIEIRRQTDNGEETGRVEFVFDHNDVKTDLTKWMNNDLRVCPRTLLQNEEDLKNMVHSKKWKEHGVTAQSQEAGTKKKRRRRRKKRVSGEQTEQTGSVDSPKASEPAGQCTEPQ